MKSNVILASLLALVGYWYTASEALLERRHEELAGQRQVISNNRSLIESEIKSMRRYLEWMLEDEVKARYRPALTVIDQLKQTTCEVIDLSDRYAKRHRRAKLDSEAIDELCKKADHSIITFESQLLMSLQLMANDFGLHEDQITAIAKSEDFSNTISTIRHLLDDNRQTANSDSLSTLHFLNMLSIQSLILEYEATLLFASMSSGRGCWFDLSSESVYAITQTERIGDPVSLLLVFSGYSVERDNIYVEINGKEYDLDHNGVIRYDGYYNAGKAYIDVKYRIINPLTGEVNESELAYYFVEP